MRWMDIAWAEIGTSEIEGSEHNGAILSYFRDVGRSDITNDETHWCAALVGACLGRAGVPVAIKKSDRLRARAYLKVGTTIPKDEPRVGAIAVFARGNDGWSGHVGFVTGWTDTHIKLLGGNQSDAVNERWFSRNKLLGFRWPEVVTAEDLEEAGSRTVKRSKQAWWDGMRSFLAELTGSFSPGSLGEAGTLATEGRQSVGALVDFAQFVGAKWPWIASLIALYFLARMLWHVGWIKFARVEDHNTGKHAGRSTGQTPDWTDAPLERGAA